MHQVDLRLPDGSIVELRANPARPLFDSLFCGTVERLPDGSILARYAAMAGRVLIIEPERRRAIQTSCSTAQRPPA